MPGEQWLTGEVMWKSLTLPSFSQFDMTWLADYPLTVKLMTWGSLALELSYAFLIWPRWTRKLNAPSTVGMHEHRDPSGHDLVRGPDGERGGVVVLGGTRLGRKTAARSAT